MSTLVFWIGMLLIVFIPPLLYLSGVRRLERWGREPWDSLLLTFAAGAVVAIILSVVLEAILFMAYDEALQVTEIFGRGYTVDTLVLACVIAPFVEEGVKGLLILRRKHLLHEEEDGMVYGAAVGLGFSATENLVYGISAYFIMGVTGFVATVLIRSISAVFLHASATGLTGHGIARAKIYNYSALPLFLAAVLLHAAYNFLASLNIVFGAEYGILSLVMVVLVGFLSFRSMKSKISKLDHGG